MKDYIEGRALEIANYLIETKATVRQAAMKFGISTSTVHKDCTDRLSQLNPGLACEVRLPEFLQLPDQFLNICFQCSGIRRSVCDSSENKVVDGYAEQV